MYGSCALCADAIGEGDVSEQNVGDTVDRVIVATPDRPYTIVALDLGPAHNDLFVDDLNEHAHDGHDHKLIVLL